jgi:sulfiredoxin
MICMTVPGIDARPSRLYRRKPEMIALTLARGVPACCRRALYLASEDPLDREPSCGSCGSRFSGRHSHRAGEKRTMLKRQMVAIQDVYVPVKRRQAIDPKKVESLAESILAKGQETPILVRADNQRFVLVEGLHRLEACKALGESTVSAYLVQARKH